MAEFDRTLNLGGHRVLVTGGAQGIGLGIARSMLDWGASVALADLSGERLSQVKDELPSAVADRVIGVPVDVTDEVSVDKALDTIWRDLGGVDLLVNCAGVLSVSNVAELALSDWRRVLDVNATGVFLTSRGVVRRLQSSGKPGSIVSLASIAGKRGDPGLSHYSASKFAVVGFTQALAQEVGDDDITVNAVCPGVVQTQMIETLADGSGTDAQEWISQQSIKRPQTPADIAFAAGFLHLSRAVTGQAILVDGGSLFS